MKTDWESVVLDFQKYLSTHLKPDTKELDSKYLMIVGKLKGELDSLIDTYTTED